MAVFLFQAKTQEGRVVRGEVTAGNESEARVRLKAQKLSPLRVIAKGAGKSKSKSKSSKAGFSLGGGIKDKELQVFTRQFATLIGSGVPVVQSLEAMIGPGRSPTLNSALKKIMEDVGQGRRLAEAMKQHPKIFNNMYVNLVHAGEEGGVLDTILNRLATYIEKSVKLKAQIKGAMFYPTAVIVVAILVVSGIMWFVIPKFVEIFNDSGMEIPALTQFVIDASDWFQVNWYFVIGGMVATPILTSQYYQTEGGRQNIDALMIKIPIIGDVIRKGSVARFSRTLSTMLSAGVRIIDALDIAAVTSQNYVVESVLLSAKESISKGRSLSDPIKASPVIPDMVGQMISVGEQTGALDNMLDKVASFYEEEVETAVAAMTSMMEPILMVVLGGIIAVLVIAMYLPIFNLAGAQA